VLHPHIEVDGGMLQHGQGPTVNGPEAPDTALTLMKDEAHSLR
jgi:hypothetical protein